MRRFLEYYRQFDELSAEEISRELVERRRAEHARTLAEVPVLDLTTAAWHEPPHAEAVNAATYALRRALNTYPDAAPLRETLAAHHGVAGEQVAAGHGAGELLRAALRAVGGVEVAVAWPGWGPLPRLVHEAGGTPVPVGLTAAGAADPEALLATGAGAVVLCTPNDPTGAAIPRPDLLALAEHLDESAWLVVDAALAEFAPDDGAPRPPSERAAGDDRAPRPPSERAAAGDDPGGDLVRALMAARERVIVVRSFSKAHAMAGLRVAYAVVGEPEVARRLAPVAGVSAPAQAAAQWAVESGSAVVARRRATAARERQRLHDGLAGTGLSFADGHGPLVWLRDERHDGTAIASHLAAQRIYVAPGTAWGDDRHVRLALRDGAATDRLVAALRELGRAS
jgi:histidinol-phosphate aminotransferase